MARRSGNYSLRRASDAVTVGYREVVVGCTDSIAVPVGQVSFVDVNSVHYAYLQASMNHTILRQSVFSATRSVPIGEVHSQFRRQERTTLAAPITSSLPLWASILRLGSVVVLGNVV